MTFRPETDGFSSPGLHVCTGLHHCASTNNFSLSPASELVLVRTSKCILFVSHYTDNILSQPHTTLSASCAFCSLSATGDARAADEDYDFLLSQTYPLSLLAALLAVVETALLRRFLWRGEPAGAGCPPGNPRRPHPTNMFWVTFGLGLVVVVFESVTVANSALAVEELGEKCLLVVQAPHPLPGSDVDVA